MISASFLSASVGSAVSQLAPQTGHAVSAAITTAAVGDTAGLGHAGDGLVNAAGADTASSTILHGVAQTVTGFSASGISNVLEPVATEILASGPSTLGATLEPSVGLLAPHVGPASDTLLTAVGSGNVAALGHALDGNINASGADISQSTILHGAAGAITALTSGAPDSFHFTAPVGGGTDALIGILSGAAGVGAHTADPVSAASAAPMDVSHFDVPLADHNPLADLAHAVHHA